MSKQRKPFDEEFEVKRAHHRLIQEHPERDWIALWVQAVKEVEQRRLERAAENV